MMCPNRYDKYRKNAKNWDTLNNYFNCPQRLIVWCFNAVMNLGDADGMANCIDPDQTAPEGAV